ncbi:MAG: alpha/beta fold hydrolase [Parvularculaceae bacterium]
MKRFLLAVLALFVLGAAAFGFLTWQALQGLDPAALEAEYMTPADRFVEVKGLRVRVREEGPPAAPPLVLLHGFTFSLESFDGWAAALSSDYRVIRFDLAGHGLTGPDPKKRYAPAERADFVGDVMDAIGIERAAVGGNSLGGLAAWRFASAHPDRVDALVLVSPGAFSANGVSDAPIEAPKAMEVYLRTAPEAGIRAGIARIFSDPSRVSDTRIRTIQDMMRRRGNGQAFVDSINEFTLPDPVADLHRVTAPTLILWGEDDVVIPVEQSARVAAEIMGARVVRYAKVGHVAQEEIPEETAAEVKAFLAAGS